MNRKRWTFTHNALDVMRAAEVQMKWHETKAVLERTSYHEKMATEFSHWVHVLKNRTDDLQLDSDDILYFWPDDAEPVTGDTPA